MNTIELRSLGWSIQNCFDKKTLKKVIERLQKIYDKMVKEEGK